MVSFASIPSIILVNDIHEDFFFLSHQDESLLLCIIIPSGEQDDAIECVIVAAGWLKMCLKMEMNQLKNYFSKQDKKKEMKSY